MEFKFCQKLLCNSQVLISSAVLISKATLHFEMCMCVNCNELADTFHSYNLKPYIRVSHSFMLHPFIQQLNADNYVKKVCNQLRTTISLHIKKFIIFLLQLIIAARNSHLCCYLSLKMKAKYIFQKTH